MNIIEKINLLQNKMKAQIKTLDELKLALWIKEHCKPKPEDIIKYTGFHYGACSPSEREMLKEKRVLHSPLYGGDTTQYHNELGPSRYVLKPKREADFKNFAVINDKIHTFPLLELEADHD